jgi:hypothetical protein
MVTSGQGHQKEKAFKWTLAREPERGERGQEGERGHAKMLIRREASKTLQRSTNASHIRGRNGVCGRRACHSVLQFYLLKHKLEKKQKGC